MVTSVHRKVARRVDADWLPLARADGRGYQGVQHHGLTVELQTARDHAQLAHALLQHWVTFMTFELDHGLTGEMHNACKQTL